MLVCYTVVSRLDLNKRVYKFCKDPLPAHVTTMSGAFSKGALNAVAPVGCSLTSYRQHDLLTALTSARGAGELQRFASSSRRRLRVAAHEHVLPKTSQEREGNHLRRTTVG